MTTGQATAVMVFGALVAVAGVVLLFRAETPGANRIRAFTVEFELSTPALVVFLAGCALVIAPFVIPGALGDTGGSGDETTAPNGDSPDGENDEAIAATTEVCGGGQTFTFEVFEPTVTGSVMHIPVRVTNPSPDTRASFVGSGLSVTDDQNRQLESVGWTWHPPSLDPGAFYDGSIDVRIDGDAPPEGVSVRTRPNGSCPVLVVSTGR